LSNQKDDQPSAVPTAVVVQDGKVPGDVPGSPDPGPAPRPRYKRKLSNYLLDKKLQLRYVILVTVLSAVISGTLGYLIYQQMHQASQEVAANLASLGDSEFQQQVARDMESRDRMLIYKMAGAGIGLVVILSLYLVIMTHKVAGPLFKVSMYFDKMTVGKLGHVTPLRKGDMLNDFYDGFREMHGAVRARLQQDAEAMHKFVEAARAMGVQGEVAKEVDALEAHVEQRKVALS
jgi:hypothetical protein